MVKWDVAERLEKKGWTIPNRLAIGAGLTYPVAWRILQDKPLDRIDVDTLEKLGKALGVRNPLKLLKHSR